MSNVKTWWMGKWNGFEKKPSEACEMGLPDILLLCIQYGCNNLPVSCIHFHAASARKRSCGYGVYVAAGNI